MCLWSIGACGAKKGPSLRQIELYVGIELFSKPQTNSRLESASH